MLPNTNLGYDVGGHDPAADHAQLAAVPRPLPRPRQLLAEGRLQGEIVTFFIFSLKITAITIESYQTTTNEDTFSKQHCE